MSLPSLRLVLAISLDGRLAPADGGAAQLGGEGDRVALEEALAWADGCLIGARTLRLHGTTCLIRRPELLERRSLEQRSPQPIAVVVSRGGALEPALPFFSQPLERWLLSSGEPQAGFQRQLLLQDWPSALRQLARLGLERLVLLGGAELASALLAERLVEELQLTLCPILLGGPFTWVQATAPDLPDPPWQLVEHRDLGGGALLLRYRRSLPPGGISSAAAADPPVRPTGI